ncbi:MAG: hypothetical protein KY461_10215 [Actinobacteria bacterium]|nr:hypothetical protein [Actinomycetota bacterium]
MEFSELRFVCQEAAVDLLASKGRPVPPTVVLPGPERTALLNIPDFPDDDEARHEVLAGLAAERIAAGGVPAWGFVAEADVQGRDALVVVFGARRHAPHLTAAFLDADDGVLEFAPDEELDPTALPFLHPLQHAVDSLPALDSPPDPGTGGLPIIS